MERSIVIVGGGVAGLAAGCYGRMNGYRTTVFELHHLPGGLCTAWERGPYVFDGCLHYLFGSAEGQPFNDLWQELGTVRGRRFLHHEEMLRVVDRDGRTLVSHADPDRLEAHMRDLSPADARPIATLCDGVRRFAGFDMALMQRRPGT